MKLPTINHLEPFFIYICNMKHTKFIFFLPVFFLLFCACDSTETAQKKTVNDTTTIKTPEELNQLNSAIAANPGDDVLYNKRAKYYYSTNNLTAGFQDIEKALSLDSTKAEYYLTLSNFYFSANKTSNAKTALEKCISLDEKNVGALLKLAELYLYVTKYNKAIEYINKALKIDMYNSSGYFMKGMCYKELKDTAKAISSMQTAVEQDKQYYHAYMQLGILCAAQKNRLAVDYYKNAIRIQPKSIEAWYDLGKYYQDINDADNAIETYKTLLKFDPDNKFVHHNMGVIYLTSLKLNEKAIESFTNAINSDPKYVEAYYGRGLTYQTIGDKKNAIANFQSCLAITPDYELAQVALKKLNKNK